MTSCLLWSGGLFFYLENNSYIRRKIAEFKENTRLTLTKVRAELQQIDSLRKSLYKVIESKSGQNVYLADMGDLFQTPIELYEKELYLKTQLRLANRVQVLEGFTQFRKPSSFNLSKSMLAGFITALFIWVVLVLFIEVIRVVRRVETS
ncbi:MAG: hypothetical protein HC880_04985 [Bacteroidia bacterium]|nr:hypothetical protein [Bacteroidia bacterium]